MAVLTLLFLPSPDAKYQTLVINDYRGIYNSAWIGLCLAMLNVMFLPIICFYLVKNGLELDRYSKTSELIAATPVSKLSLILAKWLSNIGILLTIVFVMLLSSVLIQFYYGESYQIDLWALIWPQFVFVFPLLLAIGAIAIMFESIKWLRGGLGNITYFFLWILSIVQTIENVSGIGAMFEQLKAEITTRFPEQEASSNIGIRVGDQAIETKTFIWQGVDPMIAYLSGILPLLSITVISLIIAFFCFDRFSQISIVEDKKVNRLSIFLQKNVVHKLDSLFNLCSRHWAFTRLLHLELKLILKDHSTYWLLGILVLNIIQLSVDRQLLNTVFLPVSWLWCLLIISQLGQKEKQANTLELITYSSQSTILQRLASYCSGWILLFLASTGSVLRFVASADYLLLIQLMVAISFTISLAIFCGRYSGSKRLFEALYPALWYMGPIQAAVYVDFFGVNSQKSWQLGMPCVFFVIAVALLALTIKPAKYR